MVNTFCVRRSETGLTRVGRTVDDGLYVGVVGERRRECEVLALVGSNGDGELERLLGLGGNRTGHSDCVDGDDSRIERPTRLTALGSNRDELYEEGIVLHDSSASRREAE